MHRLLSIILSLSLGLTFGIIILIIVYAKLIPPDSSLYSPLVSLIEFQKPKVIGFLPYWLLEKTQNSYKNKIDTLTYFSLTLDSDGKILKLINPQEEEPGWTTLKKDSVQEKFMLAKKDKMTTSLLVHNSDEKDIAKLLENPGLSAQNLISEVAPMMKQTGFTDLNIDIESFQNTSASAQIPFTQFLKEVKNGMIQNNLGTLTVELTPTSLIKTRLINAKEIGEIADFVVLMAYDYHYAGSYLAGPVAPIGGTGTIREFDVETAIQQALNIIPENKLILGIPLYGYEWDTVSDAPGAPTVPGTGKTASSRRVEEEILSSCDKCVKGVEKEGQEPFIIISENSYFRQVFYENKDSLTKKLNLVKKYKLGGIAFWALGYEDSTILNPLIYFEII